MSLICYLSRYAQRSICCITYVKPKTEPANAYYGNAYLETTVPTKSRYAAVPVLKKVQVGRG